jgi:hypothetical protein
MKELRLVIQIRSGGALICGNNFATSKQVDPFDVRTFNTADLTGMLSNCHELKEGTYSICVQFFNIDKIAISREMCKDFRVEASNIEYAPPTVITPVRDTKFSQQELQGQIMFRWTPLVPKPKDPVTYRLKVWQLIQGQNGTMAMRTNQPIVTKDVDNITQATVNGIYTGPCRPPYLCDFIWNVQALNKEGKPMGNNNGMSDSYTFGLAEEKITGPENTFPENKKEINSDDAMKGITFRWTPVTPKPQEPVTYRMKVWQLMQGQSGSQAMKTNQPIVTKDVADITEATVSNIYTGPCRPPYLCDFIWEVQAVTRTGTILGTSHPTEFNIKETKITGPENTFPENKKEINSDDAMKGVTFRWTPVVPKPQEPVTYRMKVWQLMQGQSGSQAMKTNQPIVTKDVADITEATVSNIYTGPCRPPYLCDFIWEVQAITKDGTPRSTSEPTEFSVKGEHTNGPDNLFPEDRLQFQPEGTKGVRFRWTPVVPKPQEPVTYRLKVWQLMQGQNSTQAMRTNQPIVTKEVDNITETTVSGIYTGPCKPPYLCDFIWIVEASTRQKGAAPQIIGNSEPTTFSLKTQSQTQIILPITEYAPPKLVAPENRKKIIPGNVGETVLFKWTAVTPKPQEPVTYRLRVWQLMQGQSGSQAMKTNQPIVTKDVDNITEATISNIYTGPCRPPYLCNFIWNVQAITINGIAVSTSKTFLLEIVFDK